MREDAANVSVGNISLFTEEELQDKTVQSLKNSNAPGIPSEI